MIKRRGGTETARGEPLTERGYSGYFRLNGCPVLARLNTMDDYEIEPGVTCRTGEYDVRDGAMGDGFKHAVSVEVFREYYTRA